ncbi:hypothetical protein EDB81DRAFT_472805 [Dactylonectria macrodidyma]|uniref:Uncharacterized protein n=1 Tax=Dactylonectria macrodidyma TaxID=307937 RepID=A0A9P9EYU3_9HYPO|nr:hypothetical protein EDB81DRAFT_472805 [Dactylonectria macrodidyma]
MPYESEFSHNHHHGRHDEPQHHEWSSMPQPSHRKNGDCKDSEKESSDKDSRKRSSGKDPKRRSVRFALLLWVVGGPSVVKSIKSNKRKQGHKSKEDNDTTTAKWVATAGPNNYDEHLSNDKPLSSNEPLPYDRPSLDAKPNAEPLRTEESTWNAEQPTGNWEHDEVSKTEEPAWGAVPPSGDWQAAEPPKPEEAARYGQPPRNDEPIGDNRPSMGYLSSMDHKSCPCARTPIDNGSPLDHESSQYTACLPRIMSKVLNLLS